MAKYSKLYHTNTLVRISDILSASIDSETILLHIENSKYYGMDTVGSRIWELLENPIKLETVIKILIEEYDVSLELCEQDVYSFITHLLKEKLVQIIDE